MGRKSKAAIGGRAIVSMGHEASYGVKVQPTHIIPFTNETLSLTEETLEDATVTGTRGKAFLEKGGETIAGDIAFNQNPDGQLPLLYHAFGSYVKLENTNGGVYGVTTRTGVVAIDAVDGAAAREVIVLRDDTSSMFEAAGGLFAMVVKDADGLLEVDDNAGAGFAYDSFCLSDVSHVRSFNAADDTYTGYATTDVVSIVLEPKILANGTIVNPNICYEGGVLKWGSARREIPYFQAVDLPLVGGQPDGVRVFLDPTVALIADPTTYPLVNSFVVISATIVAETAFASIPPLVPGQFILDFNTNYTDVNGVVAWTHFFERAATLPEGMTVEVHRDAIMFSYLGSKVNTLTLEFAPNAFVQGTVNLVCQREISLATLANDVIPGQAIITVTSVDNFPSSGKLRIGDETGMSYSAIIDNGNGTFNIVMVTTTLSNPDAIQRHHPKLSNVDPMSSNIVSNPVHGTSRLLTTMNIFPYIQGYFEEVLSAGLTLNNNLATDKNGLGSFNIFEAPEGEAMVEGNLVFEFDDGVNYNKFLTAEKFSVALKCLANNPVDAVIGETGVLKQVHYFAPTCKFNGTTPNVAGKEYIQVDMPFQASEDEAGRLSDLYCIVVNGLEFATMN